MILNKKNTLILIGVLTILNVVQLAKIYSLNNKILYNNIAIRSEFEAKKLEQEMFPDNIVLTQIQNDKSNSFYEQIDEKISVVVLFEPTGCGSCLDEKLLWNDLMALENINVVSIALHPYKTELQKYADASQIKTPIYQDSTFFLRNWFKPTKLPIKLIVKNRQVLFADYVREDTESRKQFIDFVNLYLNKYETK